MYRHAERTRKGAEETASEAEGSAKGAADDDTAVAKFCRVR